MSDSTHPALARLDRASADLLARVDLTAQLIETEGHLKQAESQCDRLVRRLADEERDVDRLEDAEAAYEQALADVVSAADASRRAGVDAASRPGPTIDPLTVVRVTNLLARRRERREVAEAVVAGHEAMSGLADALSVLRSADGWSDWDTFAGGGFISSSIKHDRMDRASGLIKRAQAALVAFGRELDDLGLPGIVLPSTDGLTRGLDIWFDNIFTDLGVRGRIKSSLTSVEEVLGQVSDVVHDLEARQRDLAPQGPLD